MLMEHIKNQILLGKIKPDDQIPSENTLAEEFSLSRHTVRKALSMLVNEGFVYTEHGKGTFCKDRRRSRSDSKNIAVITTYISEYIFPKVIQGIDNIFSENGYSVILKNTNNNTDKEGQILEEVLGKNIDGLIIEPTKSAMYSNNLKFYEALDNHNIPYIFIHGFYRQLEDKPHVLLNDAEGMRSIINYLAQQGKRKIVGIFKADDMQGLNRHNGYANALAGAGLAYDPQNVIWYHTEDKDVKPILELKHLIENQKDIDAIACYNDEIAYKVYEFLNGLGIKVPEDIAITGFDDSYFSSNCPVKITTARHPKEKLGEEAAKMLLKMIEVKNYETESMQKVIIPELVIKESC